MTIEAPEDDAGVDRVLEDLGRAMGKASRPGYYPQGMGEDPPNDWPDQPEGGYTVTPAVDQ